MRLGYGSKLNHQDMDHRLESLFPFDSASHFGCLFLTHSHVNPKFSSKGSSKQERPTPKTSRHPRRGETKWKSSGNSQKLVLRPSFPQHVGVPFSVGSPFFCGCKGKPNGSTSCRVSLRRRCRWSSWAYTRRPRTPPSGGWG